MEMEIKQDYREVIHMLEGVLLHIFRGIKGMFVTFSSGHWLRAMSFLEIQMRIVTNKSRDGIITERCASELEIVRSVYPCEEFLLPEDGREVRLTFAEAQKLLREEGPEEFRSVTDDEDMSTPQEKALGAVVRRKFGTDFYVVDRFPEGARPFYAKLAGDDARVTNAFDFFMRGQEILSGGQRIHDPDELAARIRQKGIDPASPGIREYVDVFRQAGCPAHGGGGIGLDRVVAWYLNLPSVQLAAYYPRTPKRLLP